MRAPLCLLLVAAAVLAGCAGTAPPPGGPPGPAGTPRPEPGFNTIVRLGTDLGDIYVKLFEEQVPLTAANFLRYAGSGFYDGIRVHRVVGPAVQPPDGFVIQMGDPNTRDPLKSRATWGQGDPNLPHIPDEFHPVLRHDRAGVVSMAKTPDPNTGSSQFFILLAAAPHLDDKHSVFGRVVAGLDVVRAIGEVPVDGRQAPVDDIVLRSTEVVPRQRERMTVALEAWSYTPTLNTTANHTITVSAIVRNLGNVRVPVQANLTVPEGWSWVPLYPRDTNVSAGMSQVFVFAVGSPPDAAPLSEAPVGINFTAPGVQTDTTVTLRVGSFGRVAFPGSNVTVHYIGTLTDGRLFDSSRHELATNASIPKFVGGSERTPGQFEVRPAAQYGPLGPFPLGGPGLILGFADGVYQLREGETRTVVVPPERGYGSAGHFLSGRDLVFTIELFRVETVASE